MIGTELTSEQEPPMGQTFDEFYTSEQGRLFSTLVLLTGDGHVADDISQEAFVRVFERWERVVAMDSAPAYLYRIALNLHRSRSRWIARWARRSIADGPVPDIADEATSRVAVRRALASLTAEQRVALVLTDLVAFTSEEAGRVLGIDATAVRARVHRARERIREELKIDG
jgi:RNA polymerase sigma-70 factor (ECF subfamily)